MILVSSLKSLILNRGLIFQLLKSEIAGRYRGTFLGLFWSLLNPAVMLIMYFFLFGFVFQARWASGAESKADYALFIFGGIILHSFFSEVLNRSPDLILGRPNFVKKVVFPLEALPIVTTLSSLFHFVVGFVIFAGFSLFVHGLPALASLSGLLVLPAFLLLLFGFSYYLSSLGVYLRDLGQVMGQLTTAILFLSPVLYPSTALPEAVRPLIMLNPISFPIEAIRGVFASAEPDLYGLLIYSAISVLIFLSGLWWFSKTRKGFADVI